MLSTLLSHLVASSSATVIDSWVFQLHYRFTSSVLLLLALLFTQLRIFGAHIECVDPNFHEALGKEALNSHCWTNNGHLKKITGGSALTFDSYYQYVAMILLLTVTAFYLPRHIWTWFEGGTTAALSRKLVSPILDEGQARKDVQELARYLLDNRRKHRFLLLAYILCESVSLLVDIAFLALLFQVEVEVEVKDSDSDSSIAVGFLRAVFRGDKWRPSFRPFPKDIDCEYLWPKNGSQPVLAHCVLPVNAFVQPALILLTYWMATLTILSAGALVIFRIPLLSDLGQSWYAWLRLRNFGTVPEIRLLTSGQPAFDCNDWFLLRLLKKNLHPINYRQLLTVMRDMAEVDGGRGQTSAVRADGRTSGAFGRVVSLAFRAFMLVVGVTVGTGIGDAISEAMRPERPLLAIGQDRRTDAWISLTIVAMLFRNGLRGEASSVLKSAAIEMAIVVIGAWIGVLVSTLDSGYQKPVGSVGMSVLGLVAIGVGWRIDYRKLFSGLRNDWFVLAGSSLTLLTVLCCHESCLDFGHRVGHDVAIGVDLSFEALYPLWLLAVRSSLFLLEVSVLTIFSIMVVCEFLNHL